MEKPLALKRQRAGTSARKRSYEKSAEVIVDNDVFHLDQPFTYGIPDELAEFVGVGSLVGVKFRDSLTTGVVVSLTNSRPSAVVLPIERVVSTRALTEEMIKRCETLSQRYAASLHDLLRFPLIYVSREKADDQEIRKKRRSSGKRLFHQIRGISIHEFVADFLTQEQRRTIVICDTRRNALLIQEILRERGVESFDFSDSQRKSQRNAAFAAARSLEAFIAVGQRSLLFAPLIGVERVVVLNDWSEHHWERRAPYWNVRDVALVAQEIEGFDLHFIGASPSLEISRLVEKGYIGSKRRLPFQSYSYSSARCLPDSYHQTIREGLKCGNVLVTVAGKSYVSTVICSKCRNRALCQCGAAFSQDSSGQFFCSLCAKKYESFTCNFCDGTRFISLGKGSERISEELGKAFPGRAIKVVTADSEQIEPPVETSIVVSTAGVEPAVPSGYSAIVLLDGEFLASQPSLRSEEMLFHRWSHALSLASPKSHIFLSLLPESSIAQSLMSGRSEIFIRRALKNRSEMRFPPYARFIRVKADISILRTITSSLNEEFAGKCVIYPISKGGELVIMANLDSAPDVTKALRALQRYRSSSGKTLLQISIDPYLV